MISENSSPIFIVGCGRSGTTLLRLILNGHSQIAIPEETWFFPELYRVIPTILTKGDWRETIARTIFEMNPIHFPGWKASDLLPTLERTEKNDLPGIIASVNRTFAAKSDKITWGDKTPGYVLHLPLLKKLYPGARVVHMIRDPRDVVESLLNNWNAGPQTKDFKETVDYWIKNVSAGRRDGPKYFGSSYIEVFFEKLVKNPDEELRLLCHFLKVPYQDQMLKFHGSSPGVPAWEHHKKTKQPIDPGMAFKWKKSYSNYKLAYINLAASSLLKELGYYTSLCFNFQATLSFFRRRSVGAYNKLLLKVKTNIYKLIKAPKK